MQVAVAVFGWLNCHCTPVMAFGSKAPVGMPFMKPGSVNDTMTVVGVAVTIVAMLSCGEYEPAAPVARGSPIVGSVGATPCSASLNENTRPQVPTLPEILNETPVNALAS